MASKPQPFHENGQASTIPPRTGASPAYMAKVMNIKSVKSSTPRPVPQKAASKKRKSTIDISPEDEDEEYAIQHALAGLDSPRAKKPRKKKGEEEEKRLRRERNKPPLSYLGRLARVKQQRMFLIDRKRSVAEGGLHEEEVFDIAGSTGNIYQVTISKVPSCSCPDGQKNQCKHIIYVMVNVLKAREDLAYQLALLTTELAEIFANAPVTPQSNSGVASTATDTGGARKSVEGDCPVCVMEFEPGEDLVWCKAACGQNVHRTCFEQWAKSKPGQVKCVYCRSAWKGDEDSVKRIAKGGTVGASGYVNVASELGISGQRDMSSYHPYWVARQRSHGGRYGDYEDYDE